MIGLLRGTVHERRPDAVLLLTPGGVGYEVGCSTTTLAALPPVGSETDLLTHLVVREDALTLYGFSGTEERELFHLLLGVQAVGPKMALAVLSGGTPGDVAAGIAGGDVKRLQRAPGIGKRTAERIVSELRDRLVAHAPATDGGGDGTTATGTARVASPRDEAIEGLVGLGIDDRQAAALVAASSGETAADLIADALRRSRS